MEGSVLTKIKKDSGHKEYKDTKIKTRQTEAKSEKHWRQIGKQKHRKKINKVNKQPKLIKYCRRTWRYDNKRGSGHPGVSCICCSWMPSRAVLFLFNLFNLYLSFTLVCKLCTEKLKIPCGVTKKTNTRGKSHGSALPQVCLCSAGIMRHF